MVPRRQEVDFTTHELILVYHSSGINPYSEHMVSAQELLLFMLLLEQLLGKVTPQPLSLTLALAASVSPSVKGGIPSSHQAKSTLKSG